MTTNIAARVYPPQRDTKPIPHVSLRALREVTGLTLEQLSEKIRDHFPELTVSRGTLSAIESGSRGVSDLMLQALERAYGLKQGSISLSYEPRKSPLQDDATPKDAA